MSDLLFELGSEELPARFVNPAAEALRTSVVALLDEARLTHGEAKAFGTPRRIAVLVSDVADRQPDVNKQVTGPPVKAAFDEAGKAKPAAEGFAKSQGVPLASLLRVATPKGEYLAADVHEVGKPASELLPALLTAAIGKLNFPKAMRWGDLDVTYARPLQWICALHGGAKVPVHYGDVDSGTESHGHRFLAAAPVALKSPAAYVETLRDRKVLASFDERRKQVLELAEEAASKVGKLRLDDSLLDQVANLVEWPSATLGSFDPDNLSLPPEVLLSEMKEHQRYFAVVDAAGKLLPNFVAVSATPVKDPAVSRHGYERVLRARLADARFFFDEDRKVPLPDRVDSLGTVLFQQKLGTSLEKVTRFSQLAAALCEALEVPEREALTVQHAARLCKADLVTGMVGEFPELQGTMGRAYALEAGEPPEVAQAIEEHYLPRFAGDRLPEGRAGAIVGMADRLDTLCGLFGIGKPPTGAADPFGLRRACLAIVNLTLAKGYRFSLGESVALALELLGPKLSVPAAEVRTQILDFFRARLKALWTEEQPADLVEAVLSAGFDDLWATRQRLMALAAIRGAPEFLPLAAASKRAVNLLEKAADKELATLAGGKGPSFLDRIYFDKLTDGAEKALFKAALQARQKTEQSLEKSDFAAVLRDLTALKPAIDLFFEKVLVMADDLGVRKNRLCLLAALRELFGTVADLSQIQIEGGGK